MSNFGITMFIGDSKNTSNLTDKDCDLSWPCKSEGVNLRRRLSGVSVCYTNLA